MGQWARQAAGFDPERLGLDPEATEFDSVPRPRLSLEGADLRHLRLTGNWVAGVAQTQMDLIADRRNKVSLHLKVQVLDLGGANLDRADLRNTSLSADFRNATLHRARFDGARLQGSNFHGACVSEAVFDNAELGVDLDGASVEESVRPPVLAYVAGMYGAHVSFRAASLNKVQFSDGLAGVDLRGAS